MKVVLVGTLPPPGGLNARRFAREAVRRSNLGDSVETLSGDLLSVSHRTARLGGRHLARQLRSLSSEFDAVELRVEAGLGLTARSVGGVATALRSFKHVTLFIDSPMPFRGSGGESQLLLRLWSSADSVVFANEADRAATDSLRAIEKIVMAPEPSDMAPALPPWPELGSSSLAAEVLDVLSRRARGDAEGPLGSGRASMLVTATERVHPSLSGSSIWVVKRVIGKSRGAVTKILRPTPKRAG
jgi:hypothetical protein